MENSIKFHTLGKSLVLNAAFAIKSFLNLVIRIGATSQLRDYPLGFYLEGLIPLNINELHQSKSNGLPKKLPIYFVLTCKKLYKPKQAN